MNDITQGSTATQVTCPPAWDLLLRPAILAVALLSFGVWCMTDQRPAETFSIENINPWGSWAMNFYGQFLFTALGLTAAFFTVRILRRKLIADSQGVGFVGKDKVLWSDVTGLDASELKEKQILYLLRGSGEKYALDGFNLRNFRDLVAFVEAHVPQPATTEAPPAETPADSTPDKTPPDAPS